jgi:hypothetical protein
VIVSKRIALKQSDSLRKGIVVDQLQDIFNSGQYSGISVAHFPDLTQIGQGSRQIENCTNPVLID